MKKQVLAVAIASALAAPSALAAQDTSGMQYTSAAEGFYASIRGQLDFTTDGGDAEVNGGTSRVGIRGTNDLGGGLEGFYQWEVEVGINDGDPNTGNDNEIHTRLGHAGLRGNFGELVVGSFWTSHYAFTHGSTDVANVYSGYLNYSERREGRSERSIQYTTPDLNGFQGAILAGIGSTGTDDGNDLDLWNLSAQYAIQGFTVGGAYNVIVDGNSLAAADAQSAQAALCRDGGAPSLNNGQIAAAANTRDAAIETAQTTFDAAQAVFDGIGTPTDANRMTYQAAADAYDAAVEAANEAYDRAIDGAARGTQDEATPNADTGLTCATGQGSTIKNAVNVAAARAEQTEDLTSWTLRLGYAQDNWYVNGWYGEDDYSEVPGAEDVEILSLAAGVSVDKVSLYGVYETAENAGEFGGGGANQTGNETTYGTIGVQYDLGAQSRVWIEYFSRDVDEVERDDIINIGLRHDF